MKQSTSRKEPSSKAMGFGVLGATVLLAVGTAIAWGPSGAGAPQTQAEGTESSTIRNVDGGSDYFKRFSNSLPIDPSYFPIGVWLESLTDPADAPKDRAIGINTYVELTGNSDVAHAANAGSFALTERAAVSRRRKGAFRRSGHVGRRGQCRLDRIRTRGRPDLRASGPGLWLHGPARTAQDDARAVSGLQQLRKRRDLLGRATQMLRRSSTNSRTSSLRTTIGSRIPIICGPGEGGAVLAGGQESGTRKMPTRSQLRLDGQQASVPDPAGL